MTPFQQQSQWFAVSVTVPAEAAEAIEFAFNCLDSAGTEINEMRISAGDPVVVIGYFEHAPDMERVRFEVNAALKVYGFSTDTLISLESAEVKNEDWLAEWKKHWRPTYAGRFVIAAPWHEINAPGEIVIRIEPNMAFGTGTHETTRLCLASIDKDYKPGRSFLDVGTGTGILAIAAAKMSGDAGGNFVACDTDASAVEIARENSELNGVGSSIEFFTGSIEDAPGSFDFVCANLTADVIIPILPLLLKKTLGTLVLSGILAEQERSVVGALPRKAGRPLVAHLGEWISITIRAGASRPS